MLHIDGGTQRIVDAMQAKVSELEQQVDELNQRISLQTTEKANLDSRVNILVRVLRMRDEEIAQLQQKLKVRLEAALSLRRFSC